MQKPSFNLNLSLNEVWTAYLNLIISWVESHDEFNLITGRIACEEDGTDAWIEFESFDEVRRVTIDFENIIDSNDECRINFSLSDEEDEKDISPYMEFSKKLHEMKFKRDILGSRIWLDFIINFINLDVEFVEVDFSEFVITK